MANYKEIVTKAVVGKAKKISHNDYSLKTEEVPNTVLGCWVINHLLVVGDNHCEIY
ncbi:MAG: outer spore coat protein CotE [Bacilli bacterium]|nr:outer spore coat protein CotE [Bacilli bacterium]